MRVTLLGFRGLRARAMNQRQRDDMVVLASIPEQHRLGLQSYGRARMTEELQELEGERGASSGRAPLLGRFGFAKSPARQ